MNPAAVMAATHGEKENATMQVTDEMIEAFDMAYLEAYYPDRRDFVASQGRQREAIIKGLETALAAACPEKE